MAREVRDGDPRRPAHGRCARDGDRAGYNANNYPHAFAQGITANRAISDVYEPGSVFKVVTIGGALAEHLVTPRTSFLLPY